MEGSQEGTNVVRYLQLNSSLLDLELECTQTLCRRAQLLSPVRLFATPWSRLSPWDFPGKNTRELPFPLPGDLSNLGIEPTSPALAGGFFTTEPLGKPYLVHAAASKSL